MCSHTKNDEHDVKIESSNLTIISEVSSGTTDGEAVLPTFTAYINSNTKIRALRDEGCQNNFILTSLAEKLNLKIISNHVQLNAKGFNSTRVYDTKIVEVNLNCGERWRKVEAICIPSLNFDFKLPKLSIITKEFIDKGYKLADSYLYESRDSISNIDFVLGSKSLYCLKTTQVSFGPDQDYICRE